MLNYWLEGVDEWAFKRVRDGYLFQPSIGWGLGRSPCYLVNEQQKAAISARLQKNMKAMSEFKLVYFVSILAVALALRLAQVELFTAIMTAVLTTGIAFLIAAHAYARRTIGPLLEGLPIVERRISLRERLEPYSKMLWSRILFLMGLVFVYLAVLFALEIHWPIVAIICGLIASYLFWLFFQRLRAD